MELLLGVPSLLLRNHQHRAAFKGAESGDDRWIVGETAITMDLVEIGDEAPDVVERVRPLGMARQLHAAPREIGLQGFGRSRRVRFGIH